MRAVRPDEAISADRALTSHPTMMGEQAHLAQVRGENFLNEISDGISSGSIVLYRTACQDDTE
jgi:hypothetical protein